MRKILISALALLSAYGCGSKPSSPAAPAYLIYVTNERSGDVSIIDPDTRREVGRMAIGKRPRGLVISPDKRFLYVAVSGSPIGGPGVDESALPPPDKAADGIVVINLASRQVVKTLRGVSDPEQIAISPDGERLYVASEDSGKLLVISRGGEILSEIAVGGEPEGLSVSPKGDTILATSEEEHTVSILRGQPLAAVARVEVGARPRNAVFVNDTKAVVPGENDASLSVVDLAAAKRLRTIALPKSDRPMGVVKWDDHSILVTTGRGGRLVRVDLDASGEPVVASAAVGPRPWGLAVSPDRKLAVTANGSSNDITLVDPVTFKVLGHIAVGKGPWGVAAG